MSECRCIEDAEYGVWSSTAPCSAARSNHATSTLPVSERVEGSESGLPPSDTVLLQRRRQTVHLPATTVSSASRDHGRQIRTNIRTSHDHKTNNSKSAPLNIHRLRQTRSSIHDYRYIAAAMNISSRTKHFQPRPSPVESDTAIAATEAQCDRTDPRTCLDGVTCPSAVTSHGRLPATTSEMQTPASLVKSRVSKADAIADMGVTRKEFRWLREVGQCLNPHRRHVWSD